MIDDVAIAAGLVGGAEPEQGLEGGVRIPAAVVAKRELIKVGLQVRARSAAMSAVQPRLEV